MSRVGKKIINIPKDVEIKITDTSVNVKGKFGALNQEINEKMVKVEQIDNTIRLTCLMPSKKANAYHGLMRALIQNMITGVSSQFTKTLKAVGVGYN